MRIIAFPKSGIAYNACFNQAIEALGTPVIDGVFSGRWLLANVRPGDWLHFHWPSFTYSRQGTLAAKALWFGRFVILLALSRWRGARIAWIAHNLWPHDRDRYPTIDVLGRHVIIGLSSLIFVHGPESMRILGQRFPKAMAKASLIPLGNWIDFYARDATREAARRRLGLAASTYVYLFFGLCKPYKNLEGLLRAFRELDGDVALVVAGSFADPAYREAIEQLAREDARVTLHSRFIPDEEVQCYLVACDAVVVPYREILTSGTAMLAMGFGRPLISVNLGNLRDLVTPMNGVLYDPDDPKGLSAAMRECAKREFDEAAIIAKATGYTFDNAARIVVDAMARGRPQSEAAA